MTTRLDRLFLLLDTGSTPVIRRSAAEQLGEVQKLHPHELNNLLVKVHNLLRSNTWETRIAAGQAVEAIAKNVPRWTPTTAAKSEGASCNPTGRLLLKQFDINTVLLHGVHLLGCEGVEYDIDEAPTGSCPKERLLKQKHLLNKRLGLDVAGSLGVASEELFCEDDLIVRTSPTSCQGSSDSIDKQKAVSEIVEQQIMLNPQMSNRERNRAKRKAKQLAKQKSHEIVDSRSNGSDTDSPCKRLKVESVAVDQAANESRLVVDNVASHQSRFEETEEWPFEYFCDLLLNDLLSSRWEWRHGAATGLREVLKLHGSQAGKVADMSMIEMETANQVFLQDVSMRLLCVLALDRFGDFVSDEVVAPVRETCAQTLGVVFKLMSSEYVHDVLSTLTQLFKQSQWEVRHGGLLGVKYMLAVRVDMSNELLAAVLPSIFRGLQDGVDDVCAVAAASLIPVAHKVAEFLPEGVPNIIKCLWDCLLDLDDLTASTNSIMTLLSALMSNTMGISSQSIIGSLSELVPRLWPFFRHNITSVRKASLSTFNTLVMNVSTEPPKASWLDVILQDSLRIIFQRGLLETDEQLLHMIGKVWNALLEKVPVDCLIAACHPWLGSWLCLMMQPVCIPIDMNLLLHTSHTVKESSSHRSRQPIETQVHKLYVGGVEMFSGTTTDRDERAMRARLLLGRMVGMLCHYITRSKESLPPEIEPPSLSLCKLFIFHLSSKSALQRLCTALVITEWASLSENPTDLQVVSCKILECLEEAVYFDEVAILFTRMQAECKEFIGCLKQCGVATDTHYPPGCVLTVEQAGGLCSDVFESVKASINQQHISSLEDRRKQVQLTVAETNQEQQNWTIRVQACLAGAVVVLQCLPDKLNPVIRPLMEAIKREENTQLQCLAANSLSWLLEHCSTKSPSPNAKVIRNLCNFLCCDPACTPLIKQISSVSPGVSHDAFSGIMTLSSRQKMLNKTTGRGRRKLTTQASLDIPDGLCADSSEETGSNKSQLIQRRGADAALSCVARRFGATLPTQLPCLWQAMMAALSNHETVLEKGDECVAQEIVNNLQLFESLCGWLHQDLHPKLLLGLPSLVNLLAHPFTAVRHMASRCLSKLTNLINVDCLDYVVEKVIPMLGTSDNTIQRQGAIEVLANIIDQLGIQVLPYIVLLVVPVLGRMSDQDESVRLMATSCFATLVRLMPLEAGIPDPPQMKNTLIAQKDQQREFLEQLLDGSKITPYNVPVPVKAELRNYQQDGVNWLSFLNKYNLHGILCDDMGLGKTLQSICILAGDHYLREQQYQKIGRADSAPLPSIVVCPPTLTGHWVYEVQKFVDKSYLNPLHFYGPPTERNRLRSAVKRHNLVIASYDIVRNDIDYFSSIQWNYCILDEGHIIKNGKTKLSKAVKQLRCNHRVILSGTPIQNNVLELWSLFDFLMPGFLGTEKQFAARYGRPIIQSREAKSSSSEQEAGALAMEALHRQVLPFLLRRLKEDVLQDLPPKIIQDYYCDLSPLQAELYEDFAQSRAKKTVEKSVELDEQASKMDVQQTMHIFQALQYLRKVCNHPALVMTPQHPEYERITRQLKDQGSTVRDMQHASKLTALRQLLLDCGIGGAADTAAPVVNQHRVLLFCQLKSMLDIVEKDLLKSSMPSVSFLRLDGGVAAGDRYGIVNRFNNDPSIDILLLTTHVGGLGLNLTGADTVIFVEHDWNPMKDLQAMDRAHRIGQKKVVNVYRLITRGTLEEKIMGLQKFKLNIANTVISQENSSLKTMGTNQLLDLFSLDSDTKNKAKQAQPNTEGVKSILENLDELWDEKQYETEYDLDSFMTSLTK